MSDILLELKQVDKYFGGVHAIDSFSLTMKKNAIHGLIGPNGAGKTTIFNTITGIYRADSGTILFNGENITGIQPNQATAKGIARTFQNIRLFNNLSVKENVVIACNMHASYGLADALLRTPKFRRQRAETEERAMHFLQTVGLEGHAEDKAGSLPYGHQRKLEIARAMATKPRLLLLDEPAAGMNADESFELVEFIRRLKELYPVTILMIEHHMDVVTNLCEQCTVLNFGKTLATGRMEDIRRNPEVVEAYPGGDE